MIPIRIKQLPQFVKQRLKRNKILKRPSLDNRTFHLCFFSCYSHFRYLYCSLHSIVNHANTLSFKIIVFSDEDNPLSQAQIKAIQGLIPGAKVILWPKSIGWGPTQISWIWRAFQLSSENTNDEDIIAKIDSDVFFFNDRVFQMVLRSHADLVGDGHYVNFKYCQGGCYFFRAAAVKQIVKLIENQSVDNLLSKSNILGEDEAAHYFAKQLDLEIWLTWFMMFPDELRNAGRLTTWQRSKFSCLHFVMKNKEEMLAAYEREILLPEHVKDFRKSLEIE